MRIAFCHHLSLSYLGGGEKWITQLANELVKRGHEVEIRCLPFTLEDGRKKIPHLLDEIIYREGYFHDITDADVTYVTYHPLSWLNFKTSHPRIAGFHSHAYWLPAHPRYGLLPNVANIVNRFTSYSELRHFDAVHAITDTYPINHPRVYRIPHFIDCDFFKPNEKDDEFSVAFASRAVWQKGFDTLLKVKDIIEPDIKVNISGGKVPEKELPDFYGRSHATIVPSRVNTFGLTIVESMACGTPVIATPLITRNSLDLPLVYASSPMEFAERIWGFKKIWNEYKPDYSDFAHEIRNEIESKYNKEIIVDKLERMFKEVAGI